jgi:hypothetical protein
MPLKFRIASTKLARHNFQALADQESLRFVESVSSINCETSRDGVVSSLKNRQSFGLAKLN